MTRTKCLPISGTVASDPVIRGCMSAWTRIAKVSAPKEGS
jgi:hypothetical protein